MSKPLADGETIVVPDPAQQLQYLNQVYGPTVHPEALARVREAVSRSGLEFDERELVVIAALDTPARVQDFLNNELYYNNDHAAVEIEETAMPPRRVLQTGMAHCFEGAMFAYTVDYLHGHRPQLALLEASQDSEHNLVVFQDPHTGLYGCNAHSRFLHLDGRPAEYPSIKELAESYRQHYYSDRTWDPNDITLVGYSEPFDLVPRFGVKWMSTLDPLWDIYYTYVDDTIRFHYLHADSPRSHLYPLIAALKNDWMQVDQAGQPYVSVTDLPADLQPLWHRFWEVRPPDALISRGEAREIELRFFEEIGTTPIDLQDNAEELQYFLEKGYRIEQLLTRGPAEKETPLHQRRGT